MNSRQVPRPSGLVLLALLWVPFISRASNPEQQPWPGFSRHNPRIPVESVMIQNRGHSGHWNFDPHTLKQVLPQPMNASSVQHQQAPNSTPVPQATTPPTSTDLTLAAQTYQPESIHPGHSAGPTPYPQLVPSTATPYGLQTHPYHASTYPPSPVVSATEAVVGGQPSDFYQNSQLPPVSSTPQPVLHQAPPQMASVPGAFSLSLPPEEAQKNQESRPTSRNSNLPSDIQLQLQVQLSQQIQMQLEQLQKLQDLQQKMLSVPKVVRDNRNSESTVHENIQSSEDVRKYTLLPPVPHSLFQSNLVPVLATTQAPSDVVPLVTPSPPPLQRPYASPVPVETPTYPEESQSLQSFIHGQPPQDAVRPGSGFLPIPHPLDKPADLTNHVTKEDNATDFLPFTEDATDPALPYYLIPPAVDSDSQYSSLRQPDGQNIGLDTSPSVDILPPMPETGRDNFGTFGSMPSGSAPEPGTAGPTGSFSASSGSTRTGSAIYDRPRHLRNAMGPEKGRLRPSRHR